MSELNQDQEKLLEHAVRFVDEIQMAYGQNGCNIPSVESCFCIAKGQVLAGLQQSLAFQKISSQTSQTANITDPQLPLQQRQAWRAAAKTPT